MEINHSDRLYFFLVNYLRLTMTNWLVVSNMNFTLFFRLKNHYSDHYSDHLVGGLEPFFPIIDGMSSFPLTNSIIFQDG